MRLGRSTDASGSRFDTGQPISGRTTVRTGFLPGEHRGGRNTVQG